MELIILIGIPASGKSTFYRERFFDTHVRINLDMLRTRVKEKKLFEACLAARIKVVVDNTNPTPVDRRRYIESARARGFRVVGYYFESELAACAERNRNRAERVVRPAGLEAVRARLVRPTSEEGFDELWHVRVDPAGGFSVAAWEPRR